MTDRLDLEAIKERNRGWPPKGEIVALIAEVERLRTGLLQCATEAGEDVSDGIPTWPDIVEWAVRAVRECREDAEGGYDALSGLYAACRDAELEASREVERLQADVERKDEALREICERPTAISFVSQSAAAMKDACSFRWAKELAEAALSESEEQAVSRSRSERGTEEVGLSGTTAQINTSGGGDA